MRRTNTMSSTQQGNVTDITDILHGTQERITDGFMKEFDMHIAGQDEAKRAIIKTLLTGIYALRREGVLGAIFLGGPTGVGKTELVKSLASILFGDANAYTAVQGELLKHPADVAILTGAPPGYIGYGDTPRFSDKRLYKGYNTAVASNKLHPFLRDIYGVQDLSIVLIDEAEKAHKEIITSLLGALQDGQIEMNSAGGSGGHSKMTNLHNTLFVFTSNIGEDDIVAEKRSTIGFAPSTNEDAGDNVIFRKKLEDHFPDTFIGRMNHVVRCHRVNDTMARQIMSISLAKINNSLSPYFDGNMLVELTSDYQANVLNIHQEDIKKSGGRVLIRHMNTISEHIGLAIHQGDKILGNGFRGGRMVYDINTNGLLSISLIRADTKMKLIQILPEGRRKDIVSQTIDTVLGENRKMVETYMRLISQYDTAFYDAVKDLENRLIEKIGFTEDQIKEIRMAEFLNFHDNIIAPTSAYEQVTEDDGIFGDFAVRAIKGIIAGLVRQKVTPGVVYEYIYNFAARPLTPPELHFVGYYMLQQEMLRHAKIRD